MKKTLLLWLTVLISCNCLSQPCPSSYQATFGLSTPFINCAGDSIGLENPITIGYLDSCRLVCPDNQIFGWAGNIPANFKVLLSWPNDTCWPSGSTITPFFFIFGYQYCNGNWILVQSASTGVSITFQPNPAFYLQDTVCVNEPIMLSNSSCNYTSCFWDFGNGNTSNQNNPAAFSYSSPGSNNVDLTIYPVGVCGTPKSISHDVYVRPITTVNPSLSLTLCAPDTVTVTSLMLSDNNLSVAWSINKLSGTGNGIVINPADSTPKFFISGPGTFVITLTIPNACPTPLIWKDTITLEGPPSIIINPSSAVCFTNPVTYYFNQHFTTTNVTQVNYFSVIDPNGLITQVGSVSGGILAAPQVINSAGQYIFLVTCVTSCDTISYADTLNLIMPTILPPVPNDTICRGVPYTLPYLVPNVIATINGNTIASPYVFNNPGAYVIEYTPLCGAAISQQIFVHNTATTTFNDETFCLFDTTIQLTALPNGGIYSGTGVINGLFNPSVANIGAHNIIYTVIDSNGCSIVDTAVFSVLNWNAPVYTIPDTVCVGISFQVTSVDSCIISISNQHWFIDTLTTALIIAGQHPVIMDWGGCSTSVYDTIVAVAPPSNIFSVTPISACGSSPITIDFTGVASNTTIYNWSFQGNNYNNLQLPHTFIAQSVLPDSTIIPVSLSLSNGVCPTTTVSQSLVIYEKPTPALVVSRDSVCPEDTVIITNMTSNATAVDSVRYYINEVYVGNTWTLPAQTFQAYGRDSSYVIKLVIYPRYCDPDSVEKVLVVHPEVFPIGLNTAKTRYCKEEAFYVFYKNLPANAVISLTDGAGNFYTARDSVQLLYSTPGTYVIKIRVYSCGLVEDSLVVTIDSSITPICTATTPVCQQTEVVFSNATPQQFLAFMSFDFGDGSFSNSYNAGHFYSPGVYSAQVITTTFNGCKDTLEIPIQVFENPIANFSADITTSCYRPLITYTSQSSDTLLHEWLFGNGSTSYLPDPPQQYYDSPMAYDVTLIVMTQFGCRDSLTKKDYIRILETPTANIRIIDNNLGVVSLSGAESTDAENYHWFFSSDGGEFYEMDVTKIYNKPIQETVHLVVQNSVGCEDTATLVFETNDLLDIFIPNSFSPNGDGKNEEFFPVGIGFDYDMKIVDRLGEIVFQNSNTGWNGLDQDMNECLEGVYAFIIEVRFNLEDDKHIRKGHVKLVR